ncbi:MAG: bifunctional oligoribonuclease/PAP phosphatase NrnA [Planctomycetes bacterium]|nr:bifunctional oligoribonuclease/PAP phosphatase NrnA [Planctomycetota bacterium]
MLDKQRFDDAVGLINGAKNVLVTTHTRPDGDACGSVAAILGALAGQGKNVKALMLSDVPEWYEFLFEERPAVLGRDVSVERLCGGEFMNADLIVLVDVNSKGQLPGFAEYLEKNQKKVLVFDHHVTNDGLGDVELIDVSASAAGVIVFEFLEYGGFEISEKIAEALFLAIATDTGWFRFSNTDSRSHRICAELLESGVDSAKLYHGLYQNFSIERFRLMNLMLSRLELSFDGRYASQYVLQEDFVATGAKAGDTENLIDECQRIGSVEVAALFTEQADGRIKCSLRSRGAVDVRKIAQAFGGGGHTMASGTYLPGPLEEAKKLIYEKVNAQL